MRDRTDDERSALRMIYPRCYKRLNRACLGLLLLVAVCLFFRVSVLPVIFRVSPREPTKLIEVKDASGIISGVLYLGQPERQQTQQASSFSSNNTQPSTIPKKLPDLPQPLSDIKKVLILAYYRTGSTLTGSFFDNHPSTFYSFEPLHSVHKSMYKKRPLYYFNGHTRPPPTTDNIDDLTFEILLRYFKCDFENLNWKTLTTGFLTKSHAYDSFIYCVRHLPEAHTAEKVRKECLPALTSRCLSSSAIAIKSIRVSMRIAERLLRVLPELKIIHLQRDPRGMACSMHRADCTGSIIDSTRTCGILSTDTSFKRKLPQDLSSRILDVKYESVVENPLETVRNMFDFVGIRFHSNVASWMYDCLISGKEGNGSLSVQKSNPLATAYRWTSVIHWQVVDRFQQVCRVPMADQGYPILKNLKEVRAFKIPTKNKTQQGQEIQRFFITH